MWSFSEQAAKITQITILALLAIGFASAFSDGINISALVWIAILALIAGILCVKWIDVERIVLNLE
ncbi:hypothetical protein [Luteococcus sp. OSA5]|uniref:hypothetical protein n=1 Tax=Luteococcus sp. OSA5 TaxID=3401630 RepID=UPI003B43AC94